MLSPRAHLLVSEAKSLMTHQAMSFHCYRSRLWSALLKLCANRRTISRKVEGEESHSAGVMTQTSKSRFADGSFLTIGYVSIKFSLGDVEVSAQKTVVRACRLNLKNNATRMAKLVAMH